MKRCHSLRHRTFLGHVKWEGSPGLSSPAAQSCPHTCSRAVPLQTGPGHNPQVSVPERPEGSLRKVSIKDTQWTAISEVPSNRENPVNLSMKQSSQHHHLASRRHNPRHLPTQEPLAGLKHVSYRAPQGPRGAHTCPQPSLPAAQGLVEGTHSTHAHRLEVNSSWRFFQRVMA